MIRTLLVFAILLGSVLIGIQLQTDPGYLLIAINHWTLETTLWVGATAIIITFCLLHLALLSFRWLVHIPTAIADWRTQRRLLKAQAKTRQGLIEFSEGYWKKARNHLIKALPDTDTPLLNYLTAARAAQEMGENKLRDDYLREAQQSMPEAKIAVELTQAQLQLANGQFEQALATLKHLQSLAPNHPYVLKLLMHLYEEVNDWQHLLLLLPELKKNQVIADDQYDRLVQRTYFKTLADFIKQNQTQALEKQMESLPKTLLFDPDIVELYCRYLIKEKAYAKAENLLHKTLRKQFDERLIDLYGQLKGGVGQLKTIESLQKQHPHSARLQLCLGRICAANQLWGKARGYYEASIQLNPSTAAYQELGRLLEQLDDPTRACEAYRDGLMLATQDSEG